jgi:hypothetical protein
METLTLFFALALIPSMPPAAQAPAKPATGKILQAEWLAGTWRGTAGGTDFEEHWTGPAGGTMLGMARTTSGGRIRSFEFLRIVEREGSLVYIAMPDGRTPATEFVLTAIDETSLTFENPAHDFPKRIRYSRTSEGGLEAVVSDGGQKSMTFRMTRP